MVAHLPGTIAYGVAQPAESSCGIPDQPADLPGITSAKFWHEDRCGLSGKADDNLSVRSGGGLEEVSVHCAESMTAIANSKGVSKFKLHFASGYVFFNNFIIFTTSSVDIKTPFCIVT